MLTRQHKQNIHSIYINIVGAKYCMASHWYAMRSKPHKEALLFSQLKADQIKTFYPVLRVKPVNPRARKERPYFPGYLFVHVDLEKKGFSALNWIPGANGLVTCGGEPTAIPDHIVEEIRQRVEKINQAGGEHLADLKQGDVVMIKSGPFAGYEAIFDTKLSGSQRVRVLLDLIQCNGMRAEIPSAAIQKKKKA